MHRFLEATAGQYMTSMVKTVTRDTTMRELQRMYDEDDFNCYPVRENGDIVGLVSKFDFLKCFAFNPGRMVPAYDDLLSRTVADVMTPEFIKADAGTATDGGPPDEEHSSAGRRAAAGGDYCARGCHARVDE